TSWLIGGGLLVFQAISLRRSLSSQSGDALPTRLSISLLGESSLEIHRLRGAPDAFLASPGGELLYCSESQRNILRMYFSWSLKRCSENRIWIFSLGKSSR